MAVQSVDDTGELGVWLSRHTCDYKDSRLTLSPDFNIYLSPGKIGYIPHGNVHEINT